MSLIEKINQFLIFVAVACVVVFSVVITWWLYFPYNVMDVREPVKVLTKQVIAGEFCEIELVYSKYFDIPGQRQIQLVNGMVISLDKEPYYGYLRPGINVVYRIGFVIPSWYPAGYCHAEIIASHEVNPIRTIVEKFSTEEFEVIKNDSDK